LDLRSLPVTNDLQKSVFDFGRFHEVRLIGEGAFGKVNLWQDNTSADLIAVKRVPLQFWDIIDGKVDEKVLREVQSLLRFRHPYIVPLLGYDVQIDLKVLRIAMPYIGSNSLQTVLDSPQNHPWFTVTAKTIILLGIIIGMYFVHCGGIIHRDLKPENVLLDPISHYPKIADFGVSREANANPTMRTPLSLSPRIDRTMAGTEPAGSPLYMAPEVIAGRGYSCKADIFSFGVLLYQIVTGKQPSQGVEDDAAGVYKLYEKVMAGIREEIPDTVEPLAKSLISRCWDNDPHNRPSFLEIFDECQMNQFRIFGEVDIAELVAFIQQLSARSPYLNTN
jgi:serine/threonine protein kinase